MMRDLFAHDDGGWLQDVPLLDRLVTEKLTGGGRNDRRRRVGSGSRCAVEFPYGHASGLRELEGKPRRSLTAEEQATIDALNAEQAKLECDYQDADELPEEVDQRLGEIEAGPDDVPKPIGSSMIPSRSPEAVSSSASIPKGALSVDRRLCPPRGRRPRQLMQISAEGVDASSSNGQCV